MKDNKVKNFLCLLLQLSIGVIFLYAGAVKIWGTGIDVFARDVAKYEILQSSYVDVMAAVLPWIEILIGLCLLIHYADRGAFLLAMACSFIFLIAVASAWSRGLDLSCGCFGTDSGSMNYPLKVTQLVVQFSLCLYLWSQRRLGINP